MREKEIGPGIYYVFLSLRVYIGGRSFLSLGPQKHEEENQRNISHGPPALSLRPTFSPLNLNKKDKDTRFSEEIGLRERDTPWDMKKKKQRKSNIAFSYLSMGCPAGGYLYLISWAYCREGNSRQPAINHPMSWLAVTFTTQEINSLRQPALTSHSILPLPRHRPFFPSLALWRWPSE